jgi:putative phosphoribosyl transferase
MKKTAEQREITIPIQRATLNGFLTIPSQAKGIVLFAHGSGSTRFSPRNQLVARFLNESNIATLLFDLLTPEEEEVDTRTREIRFNIPFLAERLTTVTEWISHYPDAHHLTVGYFGASTGAAAALIAAAELGMRIRALVSRGGRPDLAGHVLAHVQCPTLFLVGGNDYGVIELNQHSYDLLQCTKKFEIIPGATHLFEEPGTLEQVSRMAALWFSEYL